MKTLAGSRLKQYLRDHLAALLIDLRSRQAYGTGHLSGAINIPFEELTAGVRRLPRDAELIFYCERGGSAMAAARQFGERGRQTVAIIGSFRDISRLTDGPSGFKL